MPRKRRPPKPVALPDCEVQALPPMRRKRLPNPEPQWQITDRDSGLYEVRDAGDNWVASTASWLDAQLVLNGSLRGADRYAAPVGWQIWRRYGDGLSVLDGRYDASMRYVKD